jgi:hypothetical protein
MFRRETSILLFYKGGKPHYLSPVTFTLARLLALSIYYLANRYLRCKCVKKNWKTTFANYVVNWMKEIAIHIANMLVLKKKNLPNSKN